MNIHAIVPSKQCDEVSRRIETNYPTCFKLNQLSYLVRSGGVSHTVAVKSGIRGGNRVEGAVGTVFKLTGTYAGFAPTSQWEWLANED